MNKLNEAVESTYYTVFEACQEGILLVDRSGRIVISNKSIREMFGYAGEELNGRLVEDLIPQKYHRVHEKQRDEYMKHPTPRKMGVGRELEGLRKDGTIFPLEASLSTADINGQMHTVAYIIDITARKEMEDALKRTEEQLVAYATELEKRVKARTEQLLLANKDLEEEMKVRKKAETDAKIALERERELNELKSRFVSMASHEFRTPLSTIKSSAALIERYETSSNPEKRLQHVGKIKNSIDHLNIILNDFLSLAKLEEGRIETSFQHVDLEAILSELKEEMLPILKQGQTIKTEVRVVREVISDGKILRNVLINLISNAIKYSPEHTCITITALSDNRQLSLRIADQGIGIPDNDQQHLFERFFRAGNVLNIQGTGLGLHIVQKYIELLHGMITFESEENKGTTFTITVPLT